MTTLSGSLSPLSIASPVEEQPTHGVRSTKTTSRNNKKNGRRIRGDTVEAKIRIERAMLRLIPVVYVSG